MIEIQTNHLDIGELSVTIYYYYSFKMVQKYVYVRNQFIF